MPLSLGGQLVARALAQNEVRCVFTQGGGDLATIHEGCSRAGIDIVDTGRARTATHAADAWARLSRRPGVALVRPGPGITDALTAVATAWRAHSPLVVLAGGAELRLAGRGAPHELEQLPLVRSITKWSATVTELERLPELVHTAIRHAHNGIRGPVLLELPLDVLRAQLDDATLPPAMPSELPGAVLADPERTKSAGKLIAQAERPLLFCGRQVWWDDAAEVLREIVNRVGLPTIMDGMGRGALPSSNPHALNLARDKAFRETDCLIVVGAPLDFRVGFGAAIHPQAKIIQVDRDATQIGRNRPVDVGLVGDARSVLAQLETAAVALGARPERYEPWCESLLIAEEKARAELQPEERSDRRPIRHYRLARAIADIIDEETIVVHDGGDGVALTTRVLAPERPGQWLDAGALGSAGIGAPFALAAKKMYPHKKVLVLSGDGAFGIDGLDFELSVALRLPVTVVVANDAESPTRYDRVVEAFGGRGVHIEDPARLTSALREALGSGETTCVNVPLDPGFVQRIGASKLNV